jgi:hypothetical protein
LVRHWPEDFVLTGDGEATRESYGLERKVTIRSGLPFGLIVEVTMLFIRVLLTGVP